VAPVRLDVGPRRWRCPGARLGLRLGDPPPRPLHPATGSRVIGTFDERGAACRVGFAFGTLVGHPERGVERFVVSRSRDGEVRFDAVAVSQPGRLLRLVAGIARRAQLRFTPSRPTACARACKRN